MCSDYKPACSYASTLTLYSDKRDMLRRCKRGVNARPPAARQRPTGATNTPRPTIARGEFRRASHGHLPPTFTLWKSIDMPEQSYGVRSNIKVDNVHNPTRHDSKDANMCARAACDCHHRLSAIYSWYRYRVSPDKCVFFQ